MIANDLIFAIYQCNSLIWKVIKMKLRDYLLFPAVQHVCSILDIHRCQTVLQYDSIWILQYFRGIMSIFFHHTSSEVGVKFPDMWWNIICNGIG